MRLRPLLILPVIACTSHDVIDAGSPPDATTNDAPFCAFCDAPPYDALGGPVPPDALPPPEVDCTDAGTCPLPRSVCVNGDWLEYFDNGVCEDGGCSFDSKMKFCTYTCIDGGCQVPQLTAPTK